jgi:hypothetical protein
MVSLEPFKSQAPRQRVNQRGAKQVGQIDWWKKTVATVRQ